MNKRIQILSILFIGISQVAFSQIAEEKLILDRKREPEVKKIEKKKTSVEAEKNYPPEAKSANPVEYNITNVPAASDFKTSTIQGEDISPKFDAEYQSSYFQFGMGNFGKILADGNISTTLENQLEVGADMHFLSTTGLKKEYAWNSKQNLGTVGAYLNSFGDKGKLNVSADFGLNNYNYYGIYALTPESDINIEQGTTQVSVNGYYDYYSNEILNDIRIKSSFLGDKFDAKESQAEILLNLSKHAVELPMDGITMNADLGLNLETLRSEFTLLDENSSKLFNASVAPKVTFFKGDSYLMIGSGFSFYNAENSSLALAEDVQNKKTYWFPMAELQFAAAPEFKFYAGVDGGLKLNSYAEMLKQNPYLVSDQEMRATETKYKFYLGLRGDIDQSIKYDFRAGFGKINDMMFFRANGLFDDSFTLSRLPYDYANTFSAVYDNGTVSEVSGNVQYFPLANLMVEGELKFEKYDLDNYAHIYNIPLLNAAIGAKYSLLEKKLNLGAKAIFRSDATTNSFSFTQSDSLPNTFSSVENLDDKVGGFADLNLSAEYKVHENFSIFALGNNLLNTNYQTFKGYKVLGAQFLGGVKISF